MEGQIEGIDRGLARSVAHRHMHTVHMYLRCAHEVPQNAFGEVPKTLIPSVSCTTIGPEWTLAEFLVHRKIDDL